MTETTNSPPASRFKEHASPAGDAIGTASTEGPPAQPALEVQAHTADPAAPSIPPPAPKIDPYIGVIIDNRYKVECVLGEGGMGVVYRGRHKVIDKAVAIKILRADLARDSEITERFLREARAASAIGNPHIIDISDFGTLPDGSTYFVMEFLDGDPLTVLVDGAETPVPVMRLAHVARQIAVGLAAAHEQSIVHRDLKPDNIFLIKRGSEKDFVKILDFGIAKVASGTAKLTRHGSVFGTPHYMSPEQAAGAPLDHRTDIYSLGVIMYEMASGRLPFDAENFMGILTQHMYQAPVPIRALVPPQDIPPGLEAIILKCLSKKPEQRYLSMQELIEDLDRMLNGQQPEAVGEMMARSGGFNVPADFFKSAMPLPVPATPPGLKGRPSWPLIAGITSVLTTIAIVIGFFAFSQQGTASSAPVTSTPIPTDQPTPAEPQQVLVVADPIHAEVFLGDNKLGIAPVSVSVPESKTVTITVRAEGYIDETVELDGSQKRRDVILKSEIKTVESPPTIAKPVATTRPGPKPTTTPKPTAPKPTAPKPKSTATSKPTDGTDVVNPWGN